MSTGDLGRIYEATLKASSELDRDYYFNPNPSTTDRAEYYRRIEELGKLRQHFYAALDSTSNPDQGSNLEVTFQDNAAAQRVSVCQSKFVHDLRNSLHIVLGYTDILLEQLSKDETAVKELECIRLAGNRMSDLLKASET